MFKIVKIVSNIMGSKVKPPNLIHFYSITPELDAISIQMSHATLNPFFAFLTKLHPRRVFRCFFLPSSVILFVNALSLIPILLHD